MVAKRLECHLNAHRLPDNHLSVYRTGHSTEAALLKVNHDNAETSEKGELLLLDLFAASDVVDQGILQKRLEYFF